MRSLCAPLSIFILLSTTACGGAGSGAKSGQDVTCPPGQTFDGEFCQVDQSVATAEQSVPPEEAAPTPAESEAVPREESPAQTEGSGETETQPEEPITETEDPPPPQHATPVDVTMAAQAAPLVNYMASSHLPSGARALGSPFAGQFAQGQILERKVQLTEGKCYTVVAAGLPPIVDINIEIFIEAGKEALSKDGTTGVQAVLGSRQDCFKPPSSGTYRLVLTVAQGQGVAAAQVFEK